MARHERRQFDAQSSKRIANAVRKIERLRDRPQRSSTRPRYGPNLRLGRTYEAIAHDARGKVTLYVGDAGNEVESQQQVHAINKFAPLETNEWVLLCANARGYYIVERGSPSLVLFKLSDTLVQAGDAPAKRRAWSGTAWSDDGADITVYDSSEFGPAASGKYGVAEFNPQSNRHEIIALDRGGVELVRFYLNETLPPGGEAGAQIMEWTGAVWQPTADPPIQVYDSSSLGPAEATAEGVAWLCVESGRAEIITLRSWSEPTFLGRALDNSDNSTDIPTVPVRIVTDVSGTIEWIFGGGPVDLTVNLLPHGGVKSNIRYGDVIAFTLTYPDNEIVATSDYSAGAESVLRWAKATTKWTNLPGNGSYVQCHRALDKEGTLELDDEEEPIAITVYLPRPGGAVDPNVRTDDVIGYLVEENAEAIAVTGYLDDEIGTVKMTLKPEEDLRGGWRIYEPSPGRFPVGVTTSDEDIPATVPGATGGNKKHTHDSWSTNSASVHIAAHTGIETQHTEIEVLPHIGYYTDEAYVTVLPGGGGPVSASISGETEEAGAYINGSGAVPVQGTGTADTSAESLTTQSGGAGSGSASGTTAGAQANFSLQDSSAHTHQFNTPTNSAQAWSSGPAITALGVGTTTSDGVHTHGINQSDHSHSFSSISITISGHTHNIDAHDHSILIADIAAGLTVNGSDIAEVLSVAPHSHAFGDDVEITLPYHTHETYPHIHALPTMTHSVWPNPHNHGVDDLEHDADDHAHGIPSPPEAKHIPPFFGIHFIERYE